MDAKIITLDKECPPYHKGYHWADPDEKQATEWMKKLYEDRAFGRDLSLRAKAYLEEKLSVSNAGSLMQKRLIEIKNIC